MAEQDRQFQNGFLEEAYRPPLWVTLVFVVTMLAIYFMGRSMSALYDGPPLPQGIESIG